MCSAALLCAMLGGLGSRVLKEIDLPADRPVRRPYEQLDQAAQALVG